MDVCASFLSKGVIHLLLTIVLFYRFTAWRLLNRSISRAIDEEDEDWLFDFRNAVDWNIRSNLLVWGALVQNYSHFHFIALVLLIKFTHIPKIFFSLFYCTQQLVAQTSDSDIVTIFIERVYACINNLTSKFACLIQILIFDRILSSWYQESGKKIDWLLVNLVHLERLIPRWRDLDKDWNLNETSRFLSLKLRGKCCWSSCMEKNSHNI